MLGIKRLLGSGERGLSTTERHTSSARRVTVLCTSAAALGGTGWESQVFPATVVKLESHLDYPPIGAVDSDLLGMDVLLTLLGDNLTSTTPVVGRLYSGILTANIDADAAGTVAGRPRVISIFRGVGSGDVNGPAVSTDNALSRYDGTTGKIIQNSHAIAADNGQVIAWPAGGWVTGSAGLALSSSNAGAGANARVASISLSANGGTVDAQALAITYPGAGGVSIGANGTVAHLRGFAITISGMEGPTGGEVAAGGLRVSVVGPSSPYHLWEFYGTTTIVSSDYAFAAQGFTGLTGTIAPGTTITGGLVTGLGGGSFLSATVNNLFTIGQSIAATVGAVNVPLTLTSGHDGPGGANIFTANNQTGSLVFGIGMSAAGVALSTSLAAFSFSTNVIAPTFTGSGAALTALPAAELTGTIADARLSANVPILVGGLLPTSTLPPLAISQPFAVANQAAMLALAAERGDMAIRADNGRTYALSTDSPGTLGDWLEITSPGLVASVNGFTGAVVLGAADVGAQPLDATLTALAGVAVAADKGIYATGVDAFATYDLTAFGRSLGGAADAAAGRTLLALGTAAQANTGESGHTLPYLDGALNLWTGANSFTYTDGGANNQPVTVIVGHNTSATPVTDFGTGLGYFLQTSTTPDIPAAVEIVSWTTATHATRKARRTRYVYDTVQRETMREEGMGSSAGIGFLGAAAVARQVGDIGAALVALGLMSGTPNVTGAPAFVLAGGTAAKGVVPAPGATAHTNLPYLLNDSGVWAKNLGALVSPVSYVATEETTTSTTAVDLTTTQHIAFTLDEISDLLISVAVKAYNTTAGANVVLILDVDGVDQTIAQASMTAASTPYSFAAFIKLSAVSAAAHTLKLQFRVSAGTGGFAFRFFQIERGS